MDNRPLKDPAAGVPAPLLPHLHLMSKHKYPLMASLPLEHIVQFLLEGPKIMREAAVSWQMLDAPADGTIFLAWQPAEYMNLNFASDGYAWTDTETAYNSEVRGYNLQMLMHKAGYRPQAENVATHARRRYRLLPSNQSAQMGLPQPDGSLWLIHYSKANSSHQVAASAMPMSPQVVTQFQQRQMIQKSGQLLRKEFMFADRNQWPVINLPPALLRQGSAGQNAAHRRAQSSANEATIEEEEDISRGDMLDFMTPRDISKMRYEQHHEWMEEIVESHFSMKQIVPSELGLGRTGSLRSLTDGFFTAPTSTSHDPVNGSVGKLEPGKAAEFAKHANAKLAEMQAELEKMREEHLRRMEKLRRTTDLGAAERRMRNMNVTDDSYKAVAAQVQDMVGRKIEPVLKVKLLSKGGLQDIRPIPEAPVALAQQNSNVQQLPSPNAQPAQGRSQPFQQQQQQQHPPQPQQPPHQSPQSSHQVQSQQSQQASQPPQEDAHKSQPTESQAKSPNQQQRSLDGANHMAEPITQARDSQQASSGPTAPESGGADSTAAALSSSEGASAAMSAAPPTTEDVQTGSLENHNQDAEMENNDAVLQGDDLDMPDMDTENLIGDNNDDAADWDMLNDDGMQQNIDIPADTSSSTPQSVAAQPSGQAPQAPHPVRQAATSTPAGGDFDMVTDFDDNMDTAGDALADYTAGDDLLDDSAFGDAFHHHEQDTS